MTATGHKQQATSQKSEVRSQKSEVKTPSSALGPRSLASRHRQTERQSLALGPWSLASKHQQTQRPLSALSSWREPVHRRGSFGKLRTGCKGRGGRILIYEFRRAATGRVACCCPSASAGKYPNQRSRAAGTLTDTARNALSEDLHHGGQIGLLRFADRSGKSALSRFFVA
jgi:hypothetical protein